MRKEQEGAALTLSMPSSDFVIHDLCITANGITYRGETVEDAGAVHRALLAVMNGAAPAAPAVPQQQSRPDDLRAALTLAKNCMGKYTADSTPGYYEAMDIIFTFVESNLAAPALQVIDAPRVEPEGWKRVPVESTAVMDNAGRKALRNMLGDTAMAHDAEACYRAMLAAAPALPIARQAQPTDRDAWICVDERLPDDELCVLVDSPDWERAFVAAHFSGDDSGGSNWQDECGDELHEAPKFWMPLPKSGSGSTTEGAAQK